MKGLLKLLKKRSTRREPTEQTEHTRLKKCWHCKHYEPIAAKYGVCAKIKDTINFRDFREESVDTEASTAKEYGWPVITIRVPGYAVCNYYQKAKFRK